jgi:O-antigen/teichoic acid export membrane protein
MGDLRGRSVRGGLVTLASQGAKFVLQLGSTAVLARILAPGDFGLIAMVTVITGFLVLFKDIGLARAIVQRSEVTVDQLSTLFWINVLLSTGVALTAAAVAPLIAWVYGEPDLIAITLVLSSSFVVSGLTTQHDALLRRQMRFTALALVEIGSIVMGVSAAITMALLGFGHWALVGLIIGNAVANCVLVWTLAGWFPGRPVRGSGVRPLLAYGSGLAGFNVLNYFTRNFDNFLIGVALGSAPLGIYSKAYNLLLLPVRQINSPLGAVALPVLSRLQDDPRRYRRYYLSALSIISFVTVPIVCFSFVDAPNVVLTVLGPQWEGAIGVFRLLAPAALLGAINIAPGWLCETLGTTGRQFRWAAFSAPVIILAVWVGLRLDGIYGVAGGFSLAWSLCFVAFVVYATYETPVRAVDILMAVAPTAAAGIGAGFLAFLWIESAAPALPPPLALVVNAIVYGSAYLVLWRLVADTRPVMSLIESGLPGLAGARR